MMYYILILLLAININCLKEIPGIHFNDSLFSCYTTKENNLLYFEPSFRKLYKSMELKNSAEYSNFKDITPAPQKNIRIKTLPNILYFNFMYLSNNQIKVSFFNESFLSYFNYPNIIFSDLEHLSIDELGNNQFAIFSNNEKGSNHTLNISQFDISQTDENKFKIIKSYIIESDADRINAHCIKTNNNNIICGLIEVFLESNNTNYISYNYSLILLKNNTIDKNIFNYDKRYIDRDYVYEYKNILTHKFLKLIPLDNDRIFLSYENKGIKCGLAQVINSEFIEIIKQDEKIFDNYTFYSKLARDSFSYVKKTDNNIILSIVNESVVKFANISIDKNNKINSGNIIQKIFKFNQNPFFIKLLENNYNETIIFLSYFPSDDSYIYYGYFQELEYTSCDDEKKYVYNAEKTYLNFDFDYATFIDSEDENNIIIFNNEKTVTSLIDYDGKTLEQKKIYKKDNIYFNLSSIDYNYYYYSGNDYQFNFSNSLNERKSKICTYTISFYKCDSICTYCTSNKCWDKNWNNVKEKKEKKQKTNFEKFFFIIPGAILLMLIVLVFFTFAKCCMKGQMPNFEGSNIVQDELPLIQ